MGHPKENFKCFKLTTNGDTPVSHYALVDVYGVVRYNTANDCYNGHEWDEVKMDWYSVFKSWLTRIQDNEYPTIEEV